MVYIVSMKMLKGYWGHICDYVNKVWGIVGKVFDQFISVVKFMKSIVT